MVYLGLVISTMIWGFNFIAGRVLSLEVPPYTAGFIRFFCASLILLPISYKRYGLVGGFNARLWFGVIAMGLFGVLCYNVCFFQGMQTVEAGRASIFISTSTVILAILSAFFFGERITIVRMIGIIAALAGVVMVITEGVFYNIFATALSVGDLYIFGSVTGFVCYVMLCKWVMKDLPMIQAITWSCFFGMCFLFPLALNEDGFRHVAEYSADSWIAVVYLGAIGTVGSYLLYYNGVYRIGVTKAVVFSNFGPVVAVITGWLFLGENITLYLAFGAVMVIGGVFLVNTRDRVVVEE